MQTDYQKVSLYKKKFLQLKQNIHQVIVGKISHYLTGSSNICTKNFTSINANKLIIK